MATSWLQHLHELVVECAGRVANDDTDSAAQGKANTRSVAGGARHPMVLSWNSGFFWMSYFLSVAPCPHLIPHDLLAAEYVARMCLLWDFEPLFAGACSDCR